MEFSRRIAPERGRSHGVGGIAELPDVDSAALETPGTSSITTAEFARIAAAGAAAVIALGGAAWYARRRAAKRGNVS
ncbi:MAG: hypothetical protein IIC89_08675 [Chloroflexi bacterium]|nr:hypothetical protein [Chloroflexota bacterium]